MRLDFFFHMVDPDILPRILVAIVFGETPFPACVGNKRVYEFSLLYASLPEDEDLHSVGSDMARAHYTFIGGSPKVSVHLV